MDVKRPPVFLLWALLLCMAIISGSSGTVYVQSGSDITGCDMKCPDDAVTLELFRQCGGEERTLLEHHCHSNYTKSHYPRLRLDTESGCWKLISARKDDSCVYKIWLYTIPERLVSSTEIRVLDPVLISIPSKGSRLGEDMAVSVQYSGEESAVSWEVDGEPLPERYRLIDDNRTLIIPSVQRDDAERTFRVTITNPISEETEDYKLIDDPIFRKMLEAEDNYKRNVGISVGVCAVLLIAAGIVYIIRRVRDNGGAKGPRSCKRSQWNRFFKKIQYLKRRAHSESSQPTQARGAQGNFTLMEVKYSGTRIPKTATLNGGKTYQPVLTIAQDDGSVPSVSGNDRPVPAVTQDGPVAIATQNDGPVPAVTQNKRVAIAAQNDGPVPAVTQNEPVAIATQDDGPVPAVAQNERVAIAAQNDGPVPAVAQNEPVAIAAQNDGPVPAVTQNEPMAIAAQNDGPVPAVTQNERVAIAAQNDGPVPAVAQNERVAIAAQNDGPVPAVAQNEPVAIAAQDDGPVPAVTQNEHVAIAAQDDGPVPAVTQNGRMAIAADNDGRG